MNFVLKIRMILSVILAVLVMKIAKELMLLAKLMGMAILVINVNALLERISTPKQPSAKASRELVTREFRYPTKEVERYKVLQGTKATHTDAEKVEYNHLIDDFIELRSRPEKVHYGVVVKTPNLLLTRYLVLYKNRANHTEKEKAEYKQLFRYWRNSRFFSGVLTDA